MLAFLRCPSSQLPIHQLYAFYGIWVLQFEFIRIVLGYVGNAGATLTEMSFEEQVVNSSCGIVSVIGYKLSSLLLVNLFELANHGNNIHVHRNGVLAN
jgi:hypothetical protein